MLTFNRNVPPPWAFGTFRANAPNSATLYLPATRKEKHGETNGNLRTTADKVRQSRRTGAGQDVQAQGGTATKA